jgi:hypothetical protein
MYNLYCFSLIEFKSHVTIFLEKLTLVCNPVVNNLLEFETSKKTLLFLFLEVLIQKLVK